MVNVTPQIRTVWFESPLECLG